MSWQAAVITITLGATCARIYWSSGTFDRVKASLLVNLEHFDERRRALVVPDELLLQLLAVSSTAIMQPLDLLKIRRWVLLFICNEVYYYLIYSCSRMYLLGCWLISY